MAIRGKCVLGALALTALTSAAWGDVVNQEIFYTRFRTNFPPAPETNVNKVVASYDRTAHVLSVGAITHIARTEGPDPGNPAVTIPGADGIAFHPDGDLLVGGEITGRLFKVKRTPNVPWTFVDVGQIDAFHVKVDPNGQVAYTAGLNDPASMLAVVPLNPFSNGTSHALNGDDVLITDVIFVPGSASPPGFPNGRWFYTRSGTIGGGSFGTIDLTTFTTHRIMSNVDFAHGIQFDTYSNTLLMFGEHQIGQYNPQTDTMVGVANFLATFPNLDLDQGSVNGQGMIFAASNDGYLFAMDYSATKNVQNDANTASIAFLDSNLDDIAPLNAQPPMTCCFIGSGAFDCRDGQQSQLPGLAPPGSFDFRVADDFYLLPDRIYKIDHIDGWLLTDASPSILPKAQLELYEDCNGLPVANPFRVELNATTIVTDSSCALPGLTLYKVTFNFSDLWLKGGKSYWASFIGKGLSDPNEHWFWGTAGGTSTAPDPAHIRGRPGAFKSASSGVPNWTAVDTTPCPGGCIGCTDFAFCVHGESCKILDDQSKFVATAGSGTLSLANGSLTSAQTADDFVIPPCLSGNICYIEAYVASNCTTFRMDLFENACSSRTVNPPNLGGNLPSSLVPYRTLIPDKVEQVTVGNIPVSQGGVPLTINFPNPPPANNMISLNVYRLIFYTPGLTLASGRDWWLSAYGLTTGNTSQVAYFLWSNDACRPCNIKWQEGAVWGPRFQAGTAADPLRWVPVSSISGLGGAHDYAFLVAVAETPPTIFANGSGSSCVADFNGSGRIDSVDIFDYLSAWFAGCP